MDIIAIEDAILGLENDDTSPNNVHELASLYIVRDNLKSTLQSTSHTLNNELEDVLPYYYKYVDIKTRYQLKQTNEGEVIQGIKNVCKELKEFIEDLYCHTDMNKERICIRQMLDALKLEYCCKN